MDINMQNTNDEIINHTTTKFGIVDRLKILIGGIVRADLRIGTQHEDAKITYTIPTVRVSYPNWIQFFLNKKNGELHSPEAPTATK